MQQDDATQIACILNPQKTLVQKDFVKVQMHILPKTN